MNAILHFGRALLSRLKLRVWPEPAVPESPPPVPDTPSPKPDTSRAYTHRPCPLCAKYLAYSHGGEWTWVHLCLSGYGVVHLDGTFVPRSRVPMPTSPDVLSGRDLGAPSAVQVAGWKAAGASPEDIV